MLLWIIPLILFADHSLCSLAISMVSLISKAESAAASSHFTRFPPRGRVSLAH
jgi:hypothetical protein